MYIYRFVGVSFHKLFWFQPYKTILINYFVRKTIYCDDDDVGWFCMNCMRCVAFNKFVYQTKALDFLSIVLSLAR